VREQISEFFKKEKGEKYPLTCRNDCSEKEIVAEKEKTDNPLVFSDPVTERGNLPHSSIWVRGSSH